MTIFVDEQIPLLANSLRDVATVYTFLGRELNRNQLIRNNCEILFVRSTTKVDNDLLDGTMVKFVGTATSGTDHIDVNYLQSKNIHFVDAKGSNANSVAEYVIFSILHWAIKNRIVLKNLPVGIIGF
ncbi:MAG: erythronate-4-phosphate dehydrogenase, partial [Candidatus Kapaibacteriota bacterium]